MSARTYATDALTRHQVYLQRYANGEIKKLLPFMVQMLKDVHARVKVADATNISSLIRLEQDLTMIISESMNKLGIKLKLDMQDLGEYEAAFTTKLLDNMVTATLAGVNIDQIKAVVTNAPMTVISGKTTAKLTIDQAIKQFTGTINQSVSHTIKAGIAGGQTTDEIAEEVGRLIKNRSRAQAEALIRTSANHTGAQARKAVFDENADILEKEQFIATLDNRTSLTCAGNDGKYFDMNEGPQPPLHFNACVEGTLITARRGQIPIQNVKVGDYVLTHTGSWKRVNTVMAKPYSGTARKLVNSFGENVTLTDEHPVLTSIGYVSVEHIEVGCQVFNNATKFSDFKRWVFRSLIKKSVLIDAHNIVTKCVEGLIAYSVTSDTAGMSSAINLNNDIVDKEIDNININSLLKIKIYSVRFKEIIKQFFVKCGTGF